MNNAQRVWQSLVTNHVDKVTYLPWNKLNNLMQQVPDGVEVWNITRESAGPVCVSVAAGWYPHRGY